MTNPFKNEVVKNNIPISKHRLYPNNTSEEGRNETFLPLNHQFSPVYINESGLYSLIMNSRSTHS